MSRYQDLLAKVDAKSAEFQERYSKQLRCKKGCSSCCLPGLTVFAVERNAIRDYIRENPIEESSHPGACSFLDASGACQIYPVRPIICRTQGLPLSFKIDERPKRDVCPLNFEGEDILSLPTEGVLNLDLLNTLLVLVDQVEGGSDAGQRFGLNPKEVLG